MRKGLASLDIFYPLVGLAAIWGWSDYSSRQGTDWEIPIEGYDPRDLLRGHYVEFTYDWPGITEEGLLDTTSFCIEGTAPKVDRLRVGAEGEDCAHPVESDYSGVYGMSDLATGRLYVGQDRARILQEALWDRKQSGFVVIRQREDGRITPQDIIFRPAPDAETAEPPPITVTTAGASEAAE